jgi:hypothetical protein
VDTPQSINFLTNQDGKKYSVRNRTTIQVDSAKGYLPISIVKNIQYFCDDIPIQLAQGWDAFNISWKINIGELDGYFYPSSIEYSNIVPFSTEVDTPSVFLSPDRFVEILQNPPDSTVVPKCYERYRVRVVSLKNTLEADLGGLEIPPPPNALVFDESKN